jgi:hypothetical protein
MIKVPPPAQLRVFRQLSQPLIHPQQVAPGNIPASLPRNTGTARQSQQEKLQTCGSPGS